MQSLQLAPIVTVEQLNAALPTDEDVVHKRFPNRDFLYLNPITNDIITVPVLWMTCDFSRSLPKISILLGFFTLDNGNLKGLGYRFEAPEGKALKVLASTITTMFRSFVAMRASGFHPTVLRVVARESTRIPP